MQNISISENKKIITKSVTQNERGTILVRDEDFNYQEVEYNVDWIGKPPVIIGANTGETYTEDVNLEFVSPYGIKEIYADSYSDSFSIFADEENFYETQNLRLIPAKKNSLTARVLTNTKEMEKYRYYLDGNLCATTKEKQYTFAGLNTWEFHTIKVEALDRAENVLDSKETCRRTVPIDDITFSVENGVETISVTGLPDTTFGVGAYAWIVNKQGTKKAIEMETDNKTYCKAYIRDNIFADYSGKCAVSILVDYIDNKGVAKTMDLLGTIYVPNRYKENSYAGMPYSYTENGNYYVRCTDENGNESEVDFVIHK